MNNVRRVCGPIPSVIVRNKCDIGNQKGEPFVGEVRASCRKDDAAHIFAGVLDVLRDAQNSEGCGALRSKS